MRVTVRGILICVEAGAACTEVVLPLGGVPEGAEWLREALTAVQMALTGVAGCGTAWGVVTPAAVPSTPPLRPSDGGAVRIAEAAPALHGFQETVAAYIGDMVIAATGERHRDETRMLLDRFRRDQDIATIDQFTGRAVRAYLLKLATKGRKPKSLRLYRDGLHRFGAWCNAQHVLGENPVAGVPRPRADARPARVVPTDAQVQAIVAAAASEKRKGDEWLADLSAATVGLRWRACYLLEREHLHLDDARPHIDLPAHISKNRKRRIHPLTSEMVAAFRAHLAAIGDRTLTRKVSRTVKRTAVFVFTRVPKHRAFVRTLKRAGIPVRGPDDTTLSFHSLRHYFSNRKYRLGYTPEERRATLGHETLAMTLDVYTDPALIAAQQRVSAEPALMPKDFWQKEARGSGQDASSSDRVWYHSPMPVAPTHHDRTAEPRPSAELVSGISGAASGGRALESGCSRTPTGDTGPNGRYWTRISAADRPGASVSGLIGDTTRGTPLPPHRADVPRLVLLSGVRGRGAEDQANRAGADHAGVHEGGADTGAGSGEHANQAGQDGAPRGLPAVREAGAGGCAPRGLQPAGSDRVPLPLLPHEAAPQAAAPISLKRPSSCDRPLPHGGAGLGSLSSPKGDAHEELNAAGSPPTADPAKAGAGGFSPTVGAPALLDKLGGGAGIPEIDRAALAQRVTDTHNRWLALMAGLLGLLALAATAWLYHHTHTPTPQITTSPAGDFTP